MLNSAKFLNPLQKWENQLTSKNMLNHMDDDAHLDFLIKEFVNVYGKMADIGLDVFLEPPLWFMPIESNAAKKEAAKYFLLAVSLFDSEVTGNSRNVRILLDDFHDVFGPGLYNIKDPKTLEIETQKCENSFRFFDQMGPRKNEVPKIIADVNTFVQEKAQGDLIEHVKQMILAGKRPTELFEELCNLQNGQTAYGQILDLHSLDGQKTPKFRVI
jgi:hypothetical protein